MNEKYSGSVKIVHRKHAATHNSAVVCRCTVHHCAPVNCRHLLPNLGLVRARTLPCGSDRVDSVSFLHTLAPL